MNAALWRKRAVFKYVGITYPWRTLELKLSGEWSLQRLHEALRQHALKIASLTYIVGVAVGWLVIPIERATIGVIVWSIASVIYVSLSLYICSRWRAIEGVFVFLIGLFSASVALQQYRMAQLNGTLKVVRQRVERCTLLVLPYEHPRERYPSIELAGNEGITYQASALVLDVVEPKEELRELEGHSILLCIVERSIADLKPPIEPNSVLKVTGGLSPLPRASNPGQVSRVYKLLMNGIIARFKADVDGVAVADGESNSYPPKVYGLKAGLNLFRVRFRERLFERMRSWLPLEFREETMSLIGSMLFGMHSADLPKGIADVARRSGAIHVLVISGLHVSFIGMLVLMLVRPLGGFGIALSLFIVACYWFVSQGEPSISRAALMFAYALIGSSFKQMHRMKGYTRDWGTAVCVSAAFMVAIAPASLLNIGFQLSFAAVVGILWIGASLVNTVAPVVRNSRSRAEKAMEALIWYPAATGGAQLMTMPLISYHFSKLVLIGFISNLFVVPLALPTVALSFAGALLAIAHEAAASFNFTPAAYVAQAIATCGKTLMMVTHWLSKLLVWLMGQFANLPFATVDVPGHVAKSPVMLIVAYALLALLPLALRSLITVRRQLRGDSLCAFVRPLARLALALALAILLWVTGGIFWRLKPTATLTMLDVGQGQCIFVRAPNGRCMLVDAGTQGKDEAAGDVIAREIILPFLYRERVRQIDVLVITHPDSDHVSALPAIIERMPIGAVLDPQLPSDEPAYLRAASALVQRGVRCVLARRGQTVVLDGRNEVFASVLAPSEPLLRGTKDDVNNNVVVMCLSMLGWKILLTSDMMGEQERHLLSICRPNELRADALYVPHHGGKGSCSHKLLEVVRPKIALISCGRFNPFGHPHPEVIERLRRCGVSEILRTDEDGAIMLRVTRGSLSITRFGRSW